MKPSIGRTVHYVAPGSADGTYPPAHRAAIITEVLNDYEVSLIVLNPTGIHFVQDILRDEYAPHDPYTWHEPERE